MEMAIPDHFKAFLDELLQGLDEGFSKAGRPLSERVSEAARIVVEECLEEVDGEKPEADYLLKGWFLGILWPINDWYERRYGKALIDRSKRRLRGMVLYFDVPLVIAVPEVLFEAGKDDDGPWVRFPIEVLAYEKPLEWLETPPPIAEMKSKRKERLLASICTVATHLRAIKNDLNTATLLPEARKRAAGVLLHLDRAADTGSSHHPNARSLSVWELQMACEQTMKAHLLQRGIAVPRTHNLRDLQRLTFGPNAPPVAKSAMAAMPSERRVMDWRYGALPPPSPTELFRFYVAALSLCQLYAAGMARKYVLRNFAVRVKKPQWELAIPATGQAQ